MDTEALEQHIVKCSCLTKTPEVKYHQPWCSYRQVAALKERIEALEAAAVELRYALQDRWAANSDSELYKANARVEAADSTLAALLPGRGE